MQQSLATRHVNPRSHLFPVVAMSFTKPFHGDKDLIRRAFPYL